MGETVPVTELPPAPRGARALTGAAYGVLVVLGVVLGVVGGFQHAAYLGTEVPAAAIAWLVLLFAVVYGLGRLMRGVLGGLVPAVTWMLVSMVFSGQRGEGDLVIAGNLAGYVYLYGGFVAVLVAVLILLFRSPPWLFTYR
ncbi:DUF6113 family protein [Streptosporangium sp. KLBMP 9127]|nr:DUF6113 family protein [Streptosporangium sp. KLBMP 9127]